MPADDKRSIDERRKYLKRIYPRYRDADRTTKGALLSEMEAYTDLHRKSLLRLLNPWALRLAAPLLAAAITWRILAQVPQVRRRALWCGIYLAKLAWCWGAADRLDAEAAPHRRPDPPIASAALPGGAGR